MMKNRKKLLGLYIHIPFCIRKCEYCDFLSFPADRQLRQQYVKSLRREMELWKETACAYDVDTVFIGGGTPSVLSMEEMDMVFQGICDNFSLTDKPEFTVECNPGTVRKDKFDLYYQAGVNRLSFGMQSAVEDELKKLGRIHGLKELLDGYELARQTGFDNVNLDIMSAIPGQTRKSYEETLCLVTGLEPEHISSYSLIIEEGTPFYEQYAENPPVDEDTDRWMYERTCEVLGAAGYERYEISNYAKEGKECRHNLKYWQREEYLGIGLGASSFLAHTRFSNERDISAYEERIASGKCPVAEVEELRAEDERAEFMYLGLRCQRGISASRFQECFGRTVDECFGEEVSRFQRQGLLERRGDRIYLTRRGIDVSNYVFCEFIK